MVARSFTFRALLFLNGQQTTSVLSSEAWPTVTVTSNLDGSVVANSSDPAALAGITIESTEAYTVQILEDAPGFVFEQWTNQSTSRTRQIFATEDPDPVDITFNAYFTATAAENTVSFTIVGRDVATGEPVTGLRCFIVPETPTGQAEIFTPGVFNLAPGTEYQISANNFISPEGNTFLFSHWAGQPVGEGSNPITVNITQSQATTVFYDVTIVSAPPPPPPEEEPPEEPPPEEEPPSRLPFGLTPTQAALVLGGGALIFALRR